MWYSAVVEAELGLLAAVESGRRRGITSGYRPNHNFGSEDELAVRMGVVTVVNDEWIEPGESKPIRVKLVMPEGYLVDLYSGLQWRIQEGGLLVGNGEITKVVIDYAPMLG